MTGREREVLTLIAAGLSTAQIAHRLHRSQRTIETHRHALGRKLGARNRVELTHIAIRAGLYGPALTDGHPFDARQYRKALAAGRVGCWDWDMASRTLALNDTLCDMLGMEVDGPVEPDTMLDRIHPDDLQAVLDAAQAHLADATPHLEMRYRWQQPGGGWMQLLTRGKAWHNDQGQNGCIVGITVVLEDLTP